MAMVAALDGSAVSASSTRPPAGPLSGIAMAASIAANGAPVGEAETFLPDAHQVVAIVPIGKISHTENLHVVWSSVHAAGPPTVLLRQTIKVSSLTVAYSTATVTGTLAPGNYEVKATLGSEHASADWNVAAPPALSSATSVLQPLGTGVSAPSGFVGMASTTNLDAVLDAADAGPVTPGPDGSVNPLPIPPPPASTPSQKGVCHDLDVGAAWEPLYDLFSGATAYGCDSPITLSAAENGAPLTVIATSDKPTADGSVRATADVSLCSLPGRTDTAGTTVKVVAEQLGHPETAMDDEFTLPDIAGYGIETAGEPEPPVGTRVSPGQVIHENVVVFILNPSSQIDYGEATSNTGDSFKLDFTPVRTACGDLQGYGVVFHSGSIPPNPPAFYTLTVTAHFKDGKAASLLQSWPTGDEWKGTVDMMQHSICPASATGQADLVVDSDGVVEGTVTGNYMSDQTACNDAVANVSGSGTWPVTGRRVGQEFQLMFFPPANDSRLVLPVTVPISGNTASAQGTDLPGSSADGPISRTYSINLKCTTC
jgi:hypothetical protein